MQAVTTVRVYTNATGVKVLVNSSVDGQLFENGIYMILKHPQTAATHVGEPFTIEYVDPGGKAQSVARMVFSKATDEGGARYDQS